MINCDWINVLNETKDRLTKIAAMLIDANIPYQFSPHQDYFVVKVPRDKLLAATHVYGKFLMEEAFLNREILDGKYREIETELISFGSSRNYTDNPTRVAVLRQNFGTGHNHAIRYTGIPLLDTTILERTTNSAGDTVYILPTHHRNIINSTPVDVGVDGSYSLNKNMFEGLDTTVWDCGLDLRKYDLREVNFVGAHLHNINFEGADLSGADFRRVIFTGHTNFKDADLSGAKFAGSLFYNEYGSASFMDRNVLRAMLAININTTIF